MRRGLVEMLAARLTIGETHFFRIGPQIDALRTVVLPEIVKRRTAARQVNAWSAGCSTGEEPYTLAMLLREQLPPTAGWDIRLLATDINDRALETVRRATYGEWSFRGTPDPIRRRYFTPDGSHWRLVEPIRRMVRFGIMNLLADPIPSLGKGAAPGQPTRELDLILCRNVTIYFGAEAVRQVYRRFADALVDDGWLILGPSDPVPELPGPFEPVYLPGAVLWRRSATIHAARPALPR
jgi:chemotaxis protein methyltransferase CheR